MRIKGNHRPVSRSVVVAALLVIPWSWAGPALAQDDPGQDGYPVQHEGYREVPLFEGETTLQTRSGPKQVRITLAKLQIESGGEEAAEIALPETGLALFQHRAGELTSSLDGRRFEPLEGEWIVVDPPAELLFEAGDDSVLVDAIVVSEEPPG